MFMEMAIWKSGKYWIMILILILILFIAMKFVSADEQIYFPNYGDAQAYSKIGDNEHNRFGPLTTFFFTYTKKICTTLSEIRFKPSTSNSQKNVTVINEQCGFLYEVNVTSPICLKVKMAVNTIFSGITIKCGANISQTTDLTTLPGVEVADVCIRENISCWADYSDPGMQWNGRLGLTVVEKRP